MKDKPMCKESEFDFFFLKGVMNDLKKSNQPINFFALNPLTSFGFKIRPLRVYL